MFFCQALNLLWIALWHRLSNHFDNTNQGSQKNEKKIESLQSRNKDLRQQITALENTAIIGMVRDGGWTVDEVAQLLQQLKAQNDPNPNTETEEETE